MKNWIWLLSITIILGSCDRYDNNLIQQETIISSETGNEYQIYIVLPEGYSESKMYETVYVLDGDRWHDNTATIAKDLAIESGREVIVVGIGYNGSTQRSRDYTPTEWDNEEEGGAFEFFTFIQNDLVPFIDNNYNTENENRCIIGHSLGGLAVAYGFIHFNQLFDGYIALSPSLMWDEQVIFQMEQDLRSTNQNSTATMVMISGSYESLGIVSNMALFHDILNENYPNLTLMQEVISGKNHNGLTPTGIQKGLSFYLK